LAFSIAAVIFNEKMYGPWNYTPTVEQFAWMNGWGKVVWKAIFTASIVGSACGVVGAYRQEKAASIWLCLNLGAALISYLAAFRS
jgi:hypothetical protein